VHEAQLVAAEFTATVLSEDIYVYDPVGHDVQAVAPEEEYVPEVQTA